MLILKICVGFFSGIFKARMLKLTPVCIDTALKHVFEKVGLYWIWSVRNSVIT